MCNFRIKSYIVNEKYLGNVVILSNNNYLCGGVKKFHKAGVTKFQEYSLPPKKTHVPVCTLEMQL